MAELIEDKKDTNTKLRYLVDNGESRPVNLKEVLLALLVDKLITRKDADNLLSFPDASSRISVHPLVLIHNQKLSYANIPNKKIQAEGLTQWLAQKVNMPYYRIDPLKIDVASVTTVMSHAYAKRNRVLPVEVHPDRVVVATAEPFIRDWATELSRVLRKDVERVLSNPFDISRYLGDFYNLSQSVLGATQDSEEEKVVDIHNLEQLIELGASGDLDANDQHVIKIVDWLLQYAFDQRASDIHMEPRREHGNVKFRIDGLLHLVYQFPPPVMAAVTSRVKILGRMDVAEKRRPLDGRIKTKTPEGREVEMRLSTLPTAFGEKLVMRVFDPEAMLKDFSQLGFDSREAGLWNNAISKPNGIILVTGPTGSGKTTTLYSTLKHIAKPEVNICTIEDPIEMVEPSFNQMQVQHNIDIGFAAGVRALMRQDPDIIMVGEIRDLETAEMAIQAALTGHLVFSTLHTNNAASAVTRLLDIGVPAYLINATVIGILAQRLVRTLCPHCKKSGELDERTWDLISAGWRIKKPDKVMQAVGCDECRNTGYMGRAGIYEMLTLTESIKGMIKPECDIQHVNKIAAKEGMTPLHISGLKKVYAGLTTIEEVCRVAAISHSSSA